MNLETEYEDCCRRLEKLYDENLEYINDYRNDEISAEVRDRGQEIIGQEIDELQNHIDLLEHYLHSPDAPGVIDG